MKQDVFAAIQVAVFLFGVAWFEGTFDTREPPKMVPQFDRPHHVMMHLDRAHDELVNLALPQASMPIPHRQVQMWPQEDAYYHHSWMRNPTLVTILTSYSTTPPAVAEPNHNPDEPPRDEAATAIPEPANAVMPRIWYMSFSGVSRSSGVAHLTAS